MMERFDVEGLMRGIAARGLGNQVVHPSDYIDDEGLLVCGVCKERRQQYITIPTWGPDGHETETSMKVICLCRCEQKAENDAKQREQTQKDMDRVSKLKKASLRDEKFRGARFSEFQVTKYNARNLKLCQRYVTPAQTRSLV